MIYGAFPVLNCQRCGNDLLHKEIKAKQWYCEKCCKLIQDEKLREPMNEAINKHMRKGL